MNQLGETLNNMRNGFRFHSTLRNRINRNNDSVTTAKYISKSNLRQRFNKSPMLIKEYSNCNKRNLSFETLHNEKSNRMIPFKESIRIHKQIKRKYQSK